MEKEKALQIARERSLDLVQITEKVDPPVCKIMDYGKFLYQQEKKKRKESKKVRTEIKNVRISYTISDHDLEIKGNQIVEFLEEGHKIRIEMRLIGRQKSLTDFARKKMEKFLEMLSNLTDYRIDREIRKEPRGLTVIISPTKKKQ